MSGFDSRLDDGEAVSSLRALTNAAPSLLLDSTDQAAAITVELARPTVPRRSGRAASSLQVYTTSTGSQAGGGEGIAYYRWLELGGAAGRGHTVIRPPSSGRYLKPAGERAQAQIEHAMNKALESACRSAGVELT
jgi:hypothetical protein